MLAFPLYSRLVALVKTAANFNKIRRGRLPCLQRQHRGLGTCSERVEAEVEAKVANIILREVAKQILRDRLEFQQAVRRNMMVRRAGPK